MVGSFIVLLFPKCLQGHIFKTFMTSILLYWYVKIGCSMYINSFISLTTAVCGTKTNRYRWANTISEVTQVQKQIAFQTKNAVQYMRNVTFGQKFPPKCASSTTHIVY